MSGVFNNFNIMADGPKIVLLLVAISLWVVGFNYNKKALEFLNTNNISDMKKQVEDLRKVTWALYGVYLLQYFMNTYRPLNGMISGNTNVGVIGIVLTTIIVLCITHVSNMCTEDNCDINIADKSLKQIYMLFGILMVVHIGTLVVSMLSPSSRMGFTAEILDLLRSPKSRSFRRTPITPIYGDL